MIKMDLIYKQYVDEVFDKNGILCDIKIKVPENFNFAYDITDKLAEKTPDKNALVWCDVEGREKTVTFAELKILSDKAANYFKSIGIGRGSKVMLILKRHYEWWYMVLALHKLGAVCLPATNLLTEKDLVYRFNSAEVDTIISTAMCGVPPYVESAEAKSPTLKRKIIVRGRRDGWLSFEDGMAQAPEEFIRPTGKDASQNDDLFYLYFTSGTSGMPKMVAHDYTYPLAHIFTAKYWHNADPGGMHLTVAETGWAKAIWGKIYGQWLCETTVFVYDFDKFVPHDLLSILEKYKVTTFCAPPTIYRFFIQEDISKYDLSSLKYAAIAGEALNPEVYEKFLAATGIKLMEAFGQTETAVQVANIVGMQPKPGSMGKPSPMYDVDIVDDDLVSVNSGVVGEIIIRPTKNTVGIFKGYYKDEAMTASVWEGGVYHTGDLAWRDEDGYFWYVSRKDDIIKSSGYRIGPFEVESVLMEHPAVAECAVTGAPDPVRGQIVKATIVLAKGFEPSDELVKELQTYVKKNTAPYKYPRAVNFVEHLPKTISGKIRRTEIRAEDNK